MCEIGTRVFTGPGTVDSTGASVGQGIPGIVIGHLGNKWAIISRDDRPGDTVLCPEGMARPKDNRTGAAAVVVSPGGTVTRLTRQETARVRTSRGKDR